nr:cytochrome P450 3049B3 [Brachionus rubens]
MNLLFGCKLIFIALIGVISCFIGYFTIHLYFKKKKYSHIPGPKPSGLLGFYFGNLGEALDNIKNNKMFPFYIQECFEKYGPIFKLQLFDRVVIYSVEPNVVKFGLENFPKYSKIYKKIAYPFNKRFLGESLITQTENQKWQKDRDIFHHAFSIKRLKDYTSDFDDVASRLIDRFRTLDMEYNSINLRVEISNTIIEIIAKVAFGMELDCINNLDNEFQKNFQIILESINESFKNPFIRFKSHAKFFKAIEFIRQTGRVEILKRINSIKDEDYVPHDILSISLANNPNVDEIDIEKIIDHFVSFFIAGIETTTNALTFLFYELSRNLHVFNKVRNEIDEKIGSKPKLTYEDLENLDYIDCVFKETLRLWPVVPSINRITNKDIEIGRFKIPRETEISFSTFCAHRNSKYYSKPLDFVPERFEFDPITQKNSIHPNTYFPFSIGYRNCIGQHFAKLDSKMIVTKIIQNFDIIFDKNQSSDVDYALNLDLKHGLWCKLKIKS